MTQSLIPKCSLCSKIYFYQLSNIVFIIYWAPSTQSCETEWRCQSSALWFYNLLIKGEWSSWVKTLMYLLRVIHDFPLGHADKQNQTPVLGNIDSVIYSALIQISQFSILIAPRKIKNISYIFFEKLRFLWVISNLTSKYPVELWHSMSILWTIWHQVKRLKQIFTHKE